MMSWWTKRLVAIFEVSRPHWPMSPPPRLPQETSGAQRFHHGEHREDGTCGGDIRRKACHDRAALDIPWTLRPLRVLRMAVPLFYCLIRPSLCLPERGGADHLHVVARHELRRGGSFRVGFTIAEVLFHFARRTK